MTTSKNDGMTHTEEHVLVINNGHLRQILDATGLHHASEPEMPEGFVPCKTTEVIVDILEDAYFMPRAEAELDFECKQIIPYISFIHSFALFNYYRSPKSGEDRLVGKRSVGVGGHINPIDAKDHKYPAIQNALINGIHREMAEEVSGISDEEMESLRFIGLINTETVEVGKVHLGLSFMVKLAAPTLVPVEDALHNHGFHSLEALRGLGSRDELEPWSLILAEALWMGQIPSINADQSLETLNPSS
tara:strand:- start:7493 stop:8233 length:741 start_codon:yes stop_codon:yes gene_type:complete